MTGRVEIVCLLKKVIAKYEKETGETIIINTTASNFARIAAELHEIARELPKTAESKQHDPYPKEQHHEYRVNDNQIRDLVIGPTKKPKRHILDACYIYLYGIGRKGFALNPSLDPDLLETSAPAPVDELEELKVRIADHEAEKQGLQAATARKVMRMQKLLLLFQCIALGLVFVLALGWYDSFKHWLVLKKDMRILPYQPTAAEIDSLAGIWLCYTASPQARISDPNRYHQVVYNVVDITYKNGYFTFNRYGASFDHVGYMQFESPWLVSVTSHVENISVTPHVENAKDSIQSPRHSLLPLDKGPSPISVISASWSFDAGNRNQIIGIREVYVKIGKGGTTNAIINSLENSSCKCKIVQWHKADKTDTTFYLRNQLLDTLADGRLRKLLDENSILLREPQKGVVIGDTSRKI